MVYKCPKCKSRKFWQLADSRLKCIYCKHRFSKIRKRFLVGKRLAVKLKLGKNRRGFGTVKQPVFGILCRAGKVYAEIVPGIEAKDLQSLIEKQVRKGSTICSDDWRGYTALAAKGYVYRLVRHNRKEYSDRKGNHINSLEGFWGYLKRKLAAKGGIRKERLPIFLGEYVLRYNHRQISLKEQERLMFKLVSEQIGPEN